MDQKLTELVSRFISAVILEYGRNNYKRLGYVNRRRPTNNGGYVNGAFCDRHLVCAHLDAWLPLAEFCSILAMTVENCSRIVVTDMLKWLVFPTPVLCSAWRTSRSSYEARDTGRFNTKYVVRRT